MWVKGPITAKMFLSISGEKKNNFNMDCTLVKKFSSQTLLDYSILSLAVSPEPYGIIIVCSPILLGAGFCVLLNFQKWRLDRVPVFREGFTDFRKLCKKLEGQIS